MIIARMLWTTAGALFLTIGVAGVILPMLGTNSLALQIVLTLLAVTGTWFIARRR